MPQALKDLSDRFSTEVDAIESAFHQCGNFTQISAYKVAYIPAIEGCITALWDAWSRFNRSVLLSSAGGPVLGQSGTIYSPLQSRTEAQALIKLAADAGLQKNRIKLSGKEPIWAAPEMLLDVCLSLDLTSQHPLHSAVTATVLSLPLNSSTPNPIPEIRKVRNFCAHKGDSTFRIMRTHFRPGVLNVHSHVKQKIHGISRFSHWVDCLKVISDAATS
ncbi:hypothetical protein [Streptomyces sp. NPDC055134]